VILDTIDFDAISIRAINYERVLLRPDEEQACRGRLKRHGYRLHDWGQDTFAVRR